MIHIKKIYIKNITVMLAMCCCMFSSMALSGGLVGLGSHFLPISEIPDYGESTHPLVGFWQGNDGKHKTFPAFLFLESGGGVAFMEELHLPAYFKWNMSDNRVYVDVEDLHSKSTPVRFFMELKAGNLHLNMNGEESIIPKYDSISREDVMYSNNKISRLPGKR
ncbi:MAG: hypothetical protein P8163_07055 [Candidatus Thiodiazotropha sp.]